MSCSNLNWSARNYLFASALLLFTLIQFKADADDKYSWQWVSTTDGNASVEFPVAPIKKEITDPSGKTSIQVVMIVGDVPDKGINLRLSCNQIPPAYMNSTDSQRLEAVKASLEKGGFKIITSTNEIIGKIPVYRIVADKNDIKAHSILRVAFQHNAIYRIVATSTRGFYDDPSISRFVDSFSIR